jgi:hypothetical protein
MSREKLIVEAVTTAGLLIAFAGLVLHCGSPAQLPVESAAGALYLGDQLDCIDRAPTRADAQTCINAVRARWAADAMARDGGGQ